MTLADVPRNDLDACVRYYAARGARITGAEWRVLWGLQDEPSAFERASSSWHVVAEKRGRRG